MSATPTATKGSILVVSAHAADFVWRSGGAAALYSERGYRVRILCLSYGERGESARLWKQPGMTLAAVKAARHEEAERAAEILGAECRFFDVGDYPLAVTDALTEALVREFRTVRPDFVLTHSAHDPYNTDHGRTFELTMDTRIMAQAEGYPEYGPVIGAPPVLMFEPHQPEQCGFKPDFLLDITPVFERKRKAMECMAAQEQLWEYYTDLARRRGVQAARNSGKPVKYAESYQRVYPEVGGEFR